MTLDEALYRMNQQLANWPNPPSRADLQSRYARCFMTETAQPAFLPPDLPMRVQAVEGGIQGLLDKLAACEARIAALEAVAKRDEPKAEPDDSVAVAASRKQWSRGALPFEDMGR